MALILTLTLALTGLETEDAVKVAREAFDQVPRESFVSRLPTLSILFLRRRRAPLLRHLRLQSRVIRVPPHMLLLSYARHAPLPRTHRRILYRSQRRHRDPLVKVRLVVPVQVNRLRLVVLCGGGLGLS